MKQKKPLYKIGDICLYKDPDFQDEPDEWSPIMEIIGNPTWYPYTNHPNGGYWQYPIKDRQNECSEDLLKLPKNKHK